MNPRSTVSRLTSALAASLFVVALATVLPADAAKARNARSSAAPDSNQVLVRIGAETLTRGDVEKRIETIPEQFRSNYATPEGRQQLLDRMVEERVWLQVALKKGVASRPQVRQQLDQQRRDFLIRTYLNELMASNTAPSDSEAKAHYEAHLSEYKIPASVTVSHIQVKKEADAKRIKLLAQGKQSWESLAKKYSADSLTRLSGGSLGTVTRDGVFPGIGPQPALAESAFALGVGRIGGPYKTEKGWHIIKIDGVKAESVRPFDQVRQILIRQMSSQRSQDYYRSRLDQARKSVGVRPDSTAIKGFVSQKKSSRDMFNEAQTAGTPEARIGAYSRLLEQYPDADVSPQAQFMIGFIYSEELKNYDEAEKAFRELLIRYPKAELTASARWMLEHMRSEEAPPFINTDAESTSTVTATDSVASPGPLKNSKTPKGKGASRKP